jgi:hypothetical protein
VVEVVSIVVKSSPSPADKIVNNLEQCYTNQNSDFRGEETTRMAQLTIDPTLLADLIANTPAPPDTSHLVTEDDTPVDTWYSERLATQLRLLGIEPEE